MAAVDKHKDTESFSIIGTIECKKVVTIRWKSTYLKARSVEEKYQMLHIRQVFLGKMSLVEFRGGDLLNKLVWVDNDDQRMLSEYL